MSGPKFRDRCVLAYRVYIDVADAQGKTLDAQARLVAFKSPRPEGSLADEEHEYTPHMILEYFGNKSINIGMVVSLTDASNTDEDPCASVWKAATASTLESLTCKSLNAGRRHSSDFTQA